MEDEGSAVGVDPQSNFSSVNVINGPRDVLNVLSRAAYHLHYHQTWDDVTAQAVSTIASAMVSVMMDSDEKFCEYINGRTVVVGVSR